MKSNEENIPTILFALNAYKKNIVFFLIEENDLYTILIFDNTDSNRPSFYVIQPENAENSDKKEIGLNLCKIVKCLAPNCEDDLDVRSIKKVTCPTTKCTKDHILCTFINLKLTFENSTIPLNDFSLSYTGEEINNARLELAASLRIDSKMKIKKTELAQEAMVIDEESTDNLTLIERFENLKDTPIKIKAQIVRKNRTIQLLGGCGIWEIRFRRPEAIFDIKDFNFFCGKCAPYGKCSSFLEIIFTNNEFIDLKNKVIAMEIDSQIDIECTVMLYTVENKRFHESCNLGLYIRELLHLIEYRKMWLTASLNCKGIDDWIREMSVIILGRGNISCSFRRRHYLSLHQLFETRNNTIRCEPCKFNLRLKRKNEEKDDCPFLDYIIEEREYERLVSQEKKCGLPHQLYKVNIDEIGLLEMLPGLEEVMNQYYNKSIPPPPEFLNYTDFIEQKTKVFEETMKMLYPNIGNLDLIWPNCETQGITQEWDDFYFPMWLVPKDTLNSKKSNFAIIQKIMFIQITDLNNKNYKSKVESIINDSHKTVIIKRILVTMNTLIQGVNDMQKKSSSICLRKFHDKTPQSKQLHDANFTYLTGAHSILLWWLILYKILLISLKIEKKMTYRELYYWLLSFLSYDFTYSDVKRYLDQIYDYLDWDPNEADAIISINCNYMMGPIVIDSNDGKSHINFKDTPRLIEDYRSTSHSITISEDGLLCVIIYEHYAFFHKCVNYLETHNPHFKNKIICIASRGVGSTLLTRIISFLHQKSQVPIFYVPDFDGAGLTVAMKLKYTIPIVLTPEVLRSVRGKIPCRLWGEHDVDKSENEYTSYWKNKLLIMGMHERTISLSNLNPAVVLDVILNLTHHLKSNEINTHAQSCDGDSYVAKIIALETYWAQISKPVFKKFDLQTKYIPHEFVYWYINNHFNNNHQSPMLPIQLITDDPIPKVSSDFDVQLAQTSNGKYCVVSFTKSNCTVYCENTYPKEDIAKLLEIAHKRYNVHEITVQYVASISENSAYWSLSLAEDIIAGKHIPLNDAETFNIDILKIIEKFNTLYKL